MMANFTDTYIVFILVLLAYTTYVYGALTVQLSQTSLLVAPDSAVFVNCITSPKDDVNVRWEKNNNPVELKPAIGKEPEVYYMPNNTLKIGKIKKRNSGTYSCIAKYGAETRVEDFEVEVMFIQQANPLQPLEVYSGSTISMDCIPPHGNPAPKPLWLKDGKTFSEPSRIDQSTFTLEIRNTKMSDTANYTCVAMGFKNRTTTASLNVYTKGSFTASPKMLVIIEGKTATFMCVSKTVPELPITWVKKGLECDKKTTTCKKTEQAVKEIDPSRFKTTKNGTLEIMNVQPDDEGVYSCIQTLGSQYETLSVRLNVTELVKIKFPKSRTFIEMDAETIKKIECPHRGDDIESTTWVRKDTGDLPSHMYVDGSNLVIKSPQLNDSAFYTCTVKGKINTDTQSLNVSVYKKLKFIRRPSNVTGVLKKPLWVHCQGVGYPKPLLFYFKRGVDGGELNSTHFKQWPNGTLHILSMTKDLVGSYMCILKNDYPGGSKISRFNIRLHESGTGSTDGTSPMHRTIGIAVGCAGVYILLVIGLMIYCRARRARLLKGIITEVDEELKDPLVGDDIPMETMKNVEQLEFNREDLVELETFGHGKMGRVYKAEARCIKKDEYKTLVVVKEFPSDEKEHKDEFNLELEMFTQLNHENVVKLLGVCTTDASMWLLITDYGDEGDLKKYLTANKDLDVSDRLGMSICIANGMEYLIGQHYMHRDLAARNCVVRSNKTVMVTFLSLCEDTYKDDYYSLNDVPVPLRWLSPEAIQSESYSEKSDVWSFGVTIWEVFACGENPYSMFDNESVQKGVGMDLRLTRPDKCPLSVYAVMEKCWCEKPEDRPTFTELKQMLSEVKIDE